jgi:hypothetical protein
MDTQKAIMAFSQSEKIKAGIIWLSQSLEVVGGLSGIEGQGGLKMAQALANMVFQEIQLAKTIAGDERWEEAEKAVDQAIIMINSGVGIESIVHLTQALSQVTSIGQRTMSYLKENSLL